MTERFMFADTEAGVLHAFNHSLTLRRGGFKTRLIEERIGTTTLQVIHARPAARASRKERGLIFKKGGTR